MAHLYLSDVHPKERAGFLALMALHGIEGVKKPKGAANTHERLLSELEGNLFFEGGRDHPDINLESYSDDTDRRSLCNDPMRNAVNKKIAESKAKTKRPPMPSRRNYDYMGLQQLSGSLDRGFERDQHGDNIRRIYRVNPAYNNVVMQSDLKTVATVKKYMNRVTGSEDHKYNYSRPIYVHGLLIEGINFALDKASGLRNRFVPLPLVSKSDSDGAQPVPTRSAKKGPPPKRRGKASSDDRPTMQITNHGYIVVGRYIITNFPSHKAWLDSQPAAASTEDALLEKWRGIIMAGIDKEKKSIEARLEELTKQCMEEERRLGHVLLLDRAARDNTNSAIKKNLDQLKTIPELASFTPTDYGFVAITGDMMATRERTGAERYCGRFEIQVSMHGQVRVRNIAAPKEGYRNPHGGCIGSFGRVFGSALRVFDYYSLILAVMEYYRMVDSDHDSYWGDIPDSKEPPKKTFVSSWQNLVGEWGANSDGRDKFELDRFGPADEDRGHEDDEEEEEYDDEEDDDEDY